MWLWVSAGCATLDLDVQYEIIEDIYNIDSIATC